MKASLERTGFKHVRLEHFSGGHQVKQEEVERALRLVPRGREILTESHLCDFVTVVQGLWLALDDAVQQK